MSNNLPDHDDDDFLDDEDEQANMTLDQGTAQKGSVIFYIFIALVFFFVATIPPTFLWGIYTMVRQMQQYN